VDARQAVTVALEAAQRVERLLVALFHLGDARGVRWRAGSLALWR
jgi:hypothetical protein